MPSLSRGPTLTNCTRSDRDRHRMYGSLVHPTLHIWEIEPRDPAHQRNLTRSNPVAAHPPVFRTGLKRRRCLVSRRARMPRAERPCTQSRHEFPLDRRPRASQRLGRPATTTRYLCCSGGLTSPQSAFRYLISDSICIVCFSPLALRVVASVWVATVSLVTSAEPLPVVVDPSA